MTPVGGATERPSKATAALSPELTGPAPLRQQLHELADRLDGLRPVDRLAIALLARDALERICAIGAEPDHKNLTNLSART